MYALRTELKSLTSELKREKEKKKKRKSFIPANKFNVNRLDGFWLLGHKLGKYGP